ncbi:Putative tyrosine-protein phosphatase OCA1 [Vanrija pseudolonga]|uniref:Tyrosine-protein phosphatase OCA1 n=1 Tax=Vanrija pseudolonga TaxID=143232 RepID=A0AAF0Y460_9TREE|nr:Putative tyrosine-protein phosphatase OCA1 [Vanrija pseudolonga]
MASKQPSNTLIQVPERFSIVEPGVYRSATPTAAQVSFLGSLGLRTIISLTAEHPIPALIHFTRTNHVDFIHLGTNLFQPLNDWKPIGDEIVKAALEIILDARSHPILVIDPVGIHQTGIVLGCLRVMQGWNFASALSEYRAHSGPTKHRYSDETYIELFDPDLINLPPSHCLPSWWAPPGPGDEADDDWPEELEKPKEKEKKKKDKKGDD